MSILFRRTAPFVAVLALGLAACTSTAQTTRVEPAAAAQGSQAYPSAAGWEKISRADSVGWSAAGLDRVRERLSTLSTTGFMAVVGGRVLMDYGDLSRLSYLASVRKSILSMLFGIYRDRGKT